MEQYQSGIGEVKNLKALRRKMEDTSPNELQKQSEKATKDENPNVRWKQMQSRHTQDQCATSGNCPSLQVCMPRHAVPRTRLRFRV